MGGRDGVLQPPSWLIPFGRSPANPDCHGGKVYRCRSKTSNQSKRATRRCTQTVYSNRVAQTVSLKPCTQTVSLTKSRAATDGLRSESATLGGVDFRVLDRPHVDHLLEILDLHFAHSDIVTAVEQFTVHHRALALEVQDI